MIQGGYGVRSQGRAGTAQILEAKSDRLSTKLMVRPTKNRDKLMWKPIGKPGSVATDRGVWADILDDAKRIHESTAPTIWNWATFISPDPRIPGWNALRLSKPLDLGEVKLTPGDHSIVEGHRDHSDRFHVYPVGYWPIIVAGQVPMYRRGYAAEAAARTLRKACAFLSFISNDSLGRTVWTHCYMPSVTTEDAPYYDAVDRLREASVALSPERPPEPDWNAFEPPDWSVGAWNRLEGNLETALVDAYTHAVKGLAANEISLAAVLLNAVLEGIENPGHPKPNVPGRKPSAKAAIVDAITQVLDDKAIAKHIFAKIYDSKRSDTAHRGTMFGYEARLGMGSHTASLIPDSAHEYAQQVAILQQICRERLRIALGAPRDLPADRLIERWHDIENGVIMFRTGPGSGPYGHA